MTEQSPPANLRRTVARGATVATVGSLFSKTLTLAVYVALARLAPPETFGTFAVNGREPGGPVQRFLTPALPLNVLAGLQYAF